MEGADASSPSISGGGGGVGGEIEQNDATHEEEPNNYEKQRQSRIKENRVRLESLGLTRLSSSLFSSSSRKQQRIGKSTTPRATRKRGDEGDEEYRPSDDEADEDMGAGGRGSSHSDDEEEEDEDCRPSSSSSRPTSKLKGKKKLLIKATTARSLYLKEKMERVEDIDDETALQQAIALSLGDDAEDLAASDDQLAQCSGRYVADANIRKKKEEKRSLETPSKKKRKTNISRVRLTEDEVVAYFFAFDEVGKGQISSGDLQRLAIAHDFCWTDTEIADMIQCFDSKGEGKLSLDDFRSILSRCNMVHGHEEY